jgi:putative endonuclease
MEEGDTLVFIEVKYRRRDGHGSGAEAVTVQKQGKITRTAAWYLAKHPYRAAQNCRFDVISVSSGKSNDDIQWIKAAFYAS